jgi:hypothetical protein
MGGSTNTIRHDDVGEAPEQSPAAVDLYWLPLGAGGHVVRFNGKVYERLISFVERRRPCDLYHAALVVQVPEGRFAIESAPDPGGGGAERGVVAGGPVGSRLLGSMRIFRYEVRCWRDGVIPDLDWAIDSPQRLSEDAEDGRRLLDTLPLVPTPVWGRDELRAGAMGNSNSVVSWVLERSGIGVAAARMPAGGRAPGWDAGLVVEARG